jgi:hypothetical protein
MVFMSAIIVRARKMVKAKASHGRAVTRGAASELDHLSRVTIWNREYIDLGTEPQ